MICQKFCHNLLKISLLIVLLISLIFILIVFGSDDEYRLLQDLRENYDPIERPVQNHSEPIDVHLKLILQQIVDLDEKNQVLTLVLWTQYTWYDYKMRWSPEEYGNIQDIRFPPEALWRPDILLFNSADENFDARFPVNFVVQHTGHVTQAPPVIIKSSCEIDITWFPFDEQICYLKYGAWTYTGSKLRLFIDDSKLPDDNKMDLQYYVKNGEWELLSTPAIRNTANFEDQPYIELKFYLHIRRKTIYYGMNWIIPSILFLLSNVLGFTMPAECGEKITLQTTNLLSVTVFLGMVADVTPPTSTSVPIIGAFFSISMVILGSSIIFTLLIINVHFRSPRTHKMSPWVRTLFLEWLPWLLLMNRPGKQFKKPKKQSIITRSGDSYALSKEQQQQIKQQRSAANSPLEGRLTTTKIKQNYDSITSTVSPAIYQRIIGSSSIQPHQQYLMDYEQQQRQALLNYNSTIEPIESQQQKMTSSTSAFTSVKKKSERNDGIEPSLAYNVIDKITLELLCNTLREISDHLRISQQKMNEEEEEEEAKADWRFMAMSLDRACLFFYAILSAVIPVWIFMSIPVHGTRRTTTTT